MNKPKLLDLYCCAGGASSGSATAGFEVTGVDINLQPRYPVMLCGSMFELPIQRHRYFELSWTSLIMTSPCKHDCQPVLISGVTKRLTDGKRKMASVATRKKAIGIDWMREVELDQAIPPAYTMYLGEILLKHLNND